MVKSTEILATFFFSQSIVFKKDIYHVVLLVEMTNLTVLVHGECEALLEGKKSDNKKHGPQNMYNMCTDI